MTIIYDEYGNIFNAEAVIKDESDTKGHRLLADELLKQRNEMYKVLQSAFDAIVSLPEDSLGRASDNNNKGEWFVKDELVFHLDMVLAKVRGDL